MLALLLAGALLYVLLGDKSEAAVLASFACFSILITVIQETRTEHVLESLRDLASPRALVIRDGERQRIAGREHHVHRTQGLLIHIPAHKFPGRL